MKMLDCSQNVLVLCIVLFCFAYLVDAKKKNKCDKKDRCSCTFDDGSGTMDLSQLGKQGGDPLIKDATVSSEAYQYSFNPCYPFTEGNCYNVAGCQTNPSTFEYYDIGNADQVEFTMKGDDVIGTYTSLDGVRKSKVTYVCDPGVDPPKTEVSGEEQPYSLTYVFKITSKLVCPESGVVTSPTNGPSVTIEVEASLSVGWILVIIALCLLFVYLVGGVIFKKVVRKAEGKEVVPNVTFWSALPGYVKDGCGFTISKIRRTEYQPI